MPDDLTELRDQLAEALTREHYRRADERIAASVEEHCAAFADAVLAVVRPELEELRQSNQTMSDLMERVPKVHMRFGVLNPNGTVEQAPKCADWCWLCRIERAEATVEHMRSLARDLAARIDSAPLNGDQFTLTVIRQIADQLRALSALTAPETPGETP